MAYLSPSKLTCPTCGLSAQVETVVGVGPGSRPGDIPYRSYNEAGPFTEGKTDDGAKSLFCPEDGTCVWSNSPSKRAYGPLTKQEMQGITGRNWLVSDTENPFPPETIPYNPKDPFSGGKAYRRRPRKPG